MKIVTITSSGRKGGNTERLIDMFEKQLSLLAKENKISLEIHHVALFDEGIQPCRGCRVCFEKGEAFCPLNDSTLAIRDELLQADGLVLASPVYVEDVNGTMKNWIDRMAYTCHRPAFFGKCALLITTSGSGSTSRSLHTMNNALSAWGFDVVYMQKYRMGARIKEEELKQQFSRNLLRSASLLIDSIQNYQAQKPSLFSLLSFRVQQTYYRTSPRAGLTDHNYWEKNGWLNRKTHYYMPILTGRMKLWIAGVLGYIAAHFFT